MYTRKVTIKRIPEYLIRKMDWETLQDNVANGNFCQVFSTKRKVWEYWLISHERKEVEATLNNWKKEHKHKYIQRKIAEIMKD